MNIYKKTQSSRFLTKLKQKPEQVLSNTLLYNSDFDYLISQFWFCSMVSADRLLSANKTARLTRQSPECSDCPLIHIK